MDCALPNLPEGSVVFNYVDQKNCLLGVVSAECMAEKLQSGEKAKLSSSPEKFYILLLLAVFSEGATHPIFSPRRLRCRFPLYVLGEKNNTMLAELEDEWALLLKYSLKYSPLSCHQLRIRSGVGFSEGNANAFALAFLAQFYLAGRGERKFADLFTEFFSLEDREMLARELAIATNVEPLLF